MGRAPCCEKKGLRRGAWSPEEDQRLVAYVRQNGHPNWRALPRQAGLLRCGKSCRLRWINYLHPDIKRGNFTAEEEALVVRLHRELGNRWSAIAAQLPGRTDNEIKNVWHTHIKKRLGGDAGGGTGGRQEKKARKSRTRTAGATKRPAADVDSGERQPASPGQSSSVSSGVTFSAAAVSSSPDNAAATSRQEDQLQVGGAGKAEMEMEMESFSSAEFPAIDDSFWSSADVIDLGLCAMEPSWSTREQDMEFWLKMLLEAGDMRDLSVL